MKIVLFKNLFILSLFFILTSCYEGYIASDEASFLSKYIEPEVLKELTENPEENIWIIDVRSTSMYNNGHIPTALSYPSSDIINKISEIPQDIYLIVYCETGGRAQAVIKQLEDRGYTLMINWGGYTRWPYELVKD